VTGLLDTELPRLELDPEINENLTINVGQAYRSSEFGGSGATADDIATRPKLIVDYIPEPATFGLVGISMLALLRRQHKR